MRTLQTPVLIVGAGPAGLVTALVLAHARRPVPLVERHPGHLDPPARTGRQHAVDGDLPAPRGRGRRCARSASTPADDARWPPPLAAPERRVVQLGFPTAGRRPRRSARRRRVISPQDHVEPVLLRADPRARPDRPPVRDRARRRCAGRARPSRPPSSTRRPARRSRVDAALPRRRPTAAAAACASLGASSPSAHRPRAPRVVPVPLAGPVASLGDRRYGLYMVGGPGMAVGRAAADGPGRPLGLRGAWARSRSLEGCSRARTPRSARSGPRPASRTSRSSCSPRCRSSSRPSWRRAGAPGGRSSPATPPTGCRRSAAAA